METKTRYYYVPDIYQVWVRQILSVVPSEFEKLTLDIEEGTALIVIENREDNIAIFEYNSEKELVLTMRNEGADFEAVEIFAAALAACTNIGKGG